MSQVQAVRLKTPSEHLLPVNVERLAFDASGEALKPRAVVTSVQKQWDECLAEIAKEVPHQTIQTWFRQITPIFFVDNFLFLQVPSKFFSEWIETHYGSILTESVVSKFGNDIKVEYLIAPVKENKANSLPVTTAAEPPPVILAIGEKDQTEPQHKCRDLNHGFRFENFFVGRENEFVYNAAQVVAKKLTSAEYNPLYIFGETGSGKTHLINAMGNAIQEFHPALKLILISSERFLNDYVSAVQAQKVGQFRKSLIDADVFMFENLPSLKGKEKSQVELLYILSELLNKGAQIIITANVSPGDLKHFNPGLISFLQKGLIADIPPIETQTREKIIRHFLAKNEIYLDEKIIQFLAENLDTNIHNLRSVIVRIIAQISLTERPLVLNDVKYIVSQICPGCYYGDSSTPLRKEIGIDEIINATGSFFKVPGDLIQGVSRKQKVSQARQVAIYLCRELTDESLNCIGYHFSNLHHASVLYSYNKIKDSIEENARIRNSVQKIKALL